MHTNSINAWRECQELFSNRELMILNFLEVHKNEEFTDREIMCRLGFSDPNAVRPRTACGTPKHGGRLACVRSKANKNGKRWQKGFKKAAEKGNKKAVKAVKRKFQKGNLVVAPCPKKMQE